MMHTPNPAENSSPASPTPDAAGPTPQSPPPPEGPSGHPTHHEGSRRPTLGLPPWALLALALLAAPRVVLHDLGIIHEGTFTNGLFVFVPLIVWVAVAVWTRVPKPMLTLLVVGAFYGVFLMLGHQLLWNVGMDQTPRLGGNLAGLDPLAQELIIRGFAAISSLVTGTLVGLATGVVAWLVKLVVDRSR